jgi:hypothetical protein
MKKMMKFGSRKRFNGEEGSEVTDSEGNLIRFGYESDEDYETRSNARKAAKGRKKDVEFSGRTTPREAVEEAVDLTDRYEGAGPKQRPPGPAPLPSPASESKPTRVTSEYDVEGGLDYAPSMGTKPKPVKKKPSTTKKAEDKPPQGAFRSIRSEGGNYLPSDAESEAEARREKMLKGSFKKPKTESPKRESMFSSGRTSLKDITEGQMKRFAKGGAVGSASRRADGIAQRGKTRGKMY